MTLAEICSITDSSAWIMIVKRNNRGAVTSREFYNGIGRNDWQVTRITPTIYPMWGPTLEVEIKES